MIIKYAKAHKLARRMTFRGLEISIETDKGEKRHWFDPHTQRSGSTTMKLPYGYIRRTKGVDGDHVDVYVGPNERAKNVYIIHQMKAPEFKTYDEDKCMLGLLSADAAKKTYLAHYDNPKFFGSLTTLSFEEFKEKVLHSFELERPHKIAQTPLKHASHLEKQYTKTQHKYAYSNTEDFVTYAPEDMLPTTAFDIGATLGTGQLFHSGMKLENKLHGGLQNVNENIRPQLIEQLKKHFELPNVNVSGHPTVTGYLPTEKAIIYTTKSSPGALAHEFGHAAGKPLLPGVRRGFLAGILGSMATPLALYSTDPDSTAAKALTYGPSALMAPRLVEEGRASINAYRALKQLGHGRKALLSLLPAFGTYLTTAATPIGIAQWIRHKRRERKQHPIMKDRYLRLKKQLGIE